MKQINEFKIKFKNNSLKSRQLIINNIYNIKIKNKRLFNFRSVMDKLNEIQKFLLGRRYTTWRGGGIGKMFACINL